MKKGFLIATVIFSVSVLMGCGAGVDGGGGNPSATGSGGGGSVGGGGGGTTTPPADSVKAFSVAELVSAASSSSGKFEIKKGVIMSPLEAILLSDGRYKLTLNFQSSDGNANNCLNLYIFSVVPVSFNDYIHADTFQFLTAQNPMAARQITAEFGESQFDGYSNSLLIGCALKIARVDLGKVVITTSAQNSLKFVADIAFIRG